MLPNGKRVAILLSTYNGERFLQTCLDSLQAQDLPNITLVARDDGSRDGTAAIMENARVRSRFPFKILPGGENLGASQSFFKLLQEAAIGFDYYAFCDQDDLWFPDKLSRAIKLLEGETGNEPKLYCSRLEYIDEAAHRLGNSRVPRRVGFGNALVENIATGCTIVLNRAARELVLAQLPTKCLMHDWWCYLIVAAFGKVIYDEESRIHYRLHRGNSIGAALTFTEDARQRLNRFFRGGEGVFRSSDQAQALLECHGEKLPEENRCILVQMLEGKKSFPMRLRLAASDVLWRQRRLDNLLLKGLILINRY